MSAPVATLNLPLNPSARRGWLVYELKKRGTTVSELARREGVSREAIGTAMNQPASQIEKLIAQVLGYTPHQIWPERYDASGHRLIPTREPSRSHRDPSRRKGGAGR